MWPCSSATRRTSRHRSATACCGAPSTKTRSSRHAYEAYPARSNVLPTLAVAAEPATLCVRWRRGCAQPLASVTPLADRGSACVRTCRPSRGHDCSAASRCCRRCMIAATPYARPIITPSSHNTTSPLACRCRKRLKRSLWLLTVSVALPFGRALVCNPHCAVRSQV